MIRKCNLCRSPMFRTYLNDRGAVWVCAFCFDVEKASFGDQNRYKAAPFNKGADET